MNGVTTERDEAMDQPTASPRHAVTRTSPTLYLQRRTKGVAIQASSMRNTALARARPLKAKVGWPKRVVLSLPIGELERPIAPSRHTPRGKNRGLPSLGDCELSLQPALSEPK